MTEDTSTEMTDEQMDELVARTEESPNREIPMTAEESEPQAAEAKPKEEHYEFTHNGKKIRGTREQLITWAQQGYDYPQKAQKLNQERQRWDQDKTQWEQQWGTYKQIDEWAKQNPDKWSALKQSWETQQRGGAIAQPGQPADPYSPKLQALESELNQIKPVLSQYLQEKEESRLKAEDEKLDQEIKSIREKYTDLDFDSPDETGKSLEFKVLEHAQKNGIPTYGAAFKDFYHDQLIARAEAQAKTTVAKGIQQKTKLGILGESPSPRKGIQPAKDFKNKSYEDLTREAIAELRSGT